MKSWLRKHRLKLSVATAFALVSVPTYFALFPPSATWPPRYAKVIILVIWALGAVYVTIGAERRGQTIDRLSARHEQLAKNLRVTALTASLRALLRRGTMDMPESFEFIVYVYDSDEDKEILTPIFPRWDPADGEDPRIFEPGNGATGRAWDDDLATFVVLGEKVHTGDYGLTDVQQDYYREYFAVAATPIRWLATERKGVLTALSKAEDTHFLTEHGRAALEKLANTIGVLLETLQDDPEV